MSTLTHRLYEIWLEEGTDLLDDHLHKTATDRAVRAANLFYLRSGGEVLTYHIAVCQRHWKTPTEAP